MADPDLSQFMTPEKDSTQGPDLSAFMGPTLSAADQHLAHPTVDDMLRPQRKPVGGRAGAAVRGATRGVIPTGTAAMGAATGAEIGALGGPFDPVTIPVGALIGGGLGYWAGQKAQKSVMDAVPKGALQVMGQDPASVKLDQQTYPMTSAISEAAPSLIAGGALQRGMTRPEIADRAMMVAQLKASAADAMDARMARFKTADVDPSSATVGGPLTQGFAEFTAKGPLSAGARRSLAGQIGQAETAVTRTASAYGAPTTPNLAGGTLQEGINRYVGDVATPGSFKAKVEGMYDAAFDPILKGEAQAVAKSEADQAAKVGTLKGDHAAQLEEAQAAQRGEQLAAEQGMPVPADQQTPTPQPPELPPAQPTTATGKTQETLNTIASTINSPAIRGIIQDPRIPAILNAFEKEPASVRFTDLRSLRTWVRNAQGNPDLILGVGQGNLQKLESALTEDIYTNAQKFGGDAALNRLKRTDDFYRAGVQRIQTALQPFIDKSSPEGAFARIQGIASSGSSADVNSLFRLKRSLPPADFGDVQASLIQNAGQVADGSGKTAFSPAAFVGWYSKLPEASKDILFGAGGSAAKAKPAAAALKTQLDNLVSVAGDLAPWEKIASAQGMKGASPWQVGTSGTAAMYAVASLHPMAILGEAAALGGEALTAQFLTSPAALRWINRLSTSKSAQALDAAVGGLSRASKSSPVLASLHSAVSQAMVNAQNPPQKPAEAHGGFDPSQMTDEELKAAGGAPEPSEHAAQPSDEGRVAMIDSMTPKEAMALTIAGEASSDPHEMAGVGHVMANRLASGKYGSTMADILKPAEFNVWENPTKLAELKGTPKYEAALQIAEQVLSGTHADVTGGARHYFAPRALAELHKTQPEKYPHERPEWAQGDGTALGESVFYP